MTRIDLYTVLEVRRAASVNEIKRAFRKLARRYHPDINPGDGSAEELFKRITEAYDVLSDPLKREFYDLNGFYTEGVLENGTANPGWGFSYQGFDFSQSPSSDFSEIFGSVFRRTPARREPERGQDLEYQISISFEESIRGVQTNIGIISKRSCMACKGTGQASGTRETACIPCSGSGRTIRTKGHLQFAVTCGECGGSGRTVMPCVSCSGEGRIPGSENIGVELPPGIMAGSRIRFPEKGDAGRCGGPAGDLYVVVHAAAHTFFERKGNNLHCSVPVTVSEASLGAKIEVPTIDGTAIVRIPPGTQTGQAFRLRGRGMPSMMNPGTRGDQYVEVKVVVPRVADERSKEILRELAKLNPENPRKHLWR